MTDPLIALCEEEPQALLAAPQDCTVEGGEGLGGRGEGGLLRLEQHLQGTLLQGAVVHTSE